jgi:hypothetical protein
MKAPTNRWRLIRPAALIVILVVVIAGYYAHCSANPMLRANGDFGGTMWMIGFMMTVGGLAWGLVQASREFWR